MLLDYHTHTNLTNSNHALGSMEEYVEQALQRGLAELGFSEHLFVSQMNEFRAKFANIKLSRQTGVAPLFKLFDTYVSKIQELQKKYTNIKIKIGTEVDYVPEHEDLIQAILTEYPFDYVIGSIHYLDGWGFDNPVEKDGFNTRDVNDVYLEYLNQIELTARSGLFDIIGHLDLVKIFGYRPTRNIMAAVEKTVKAIAEMNLAIEINTAGLRKPVKEIYPQEDWLQLCYHYHIPVILGSDAHHPQDVGAGFQQAVTLLNKVGYTQLASYTKRKRTYVKL